MLIQTLCYKARKYLQQGKWVPDAGAVNICANRETAYIRGLMGLYKVILPYEELVKQDADFAKHYVGEPGKPIRFIFEAIKHMFLFLKDELRELNFLHSPFLKPILQSVFGQISYASPPMNESDYQLALYTFKKQQGVERNILGRSHSLYPRILEGPHQPTPYWQSPTPTRAAQIKVLISFIIFIPTYSIFKVRIHNRTSASNKNFWQERHRARCGGFGNSPSMYLWHFRSKWCREVNSVKSSGIYKPTNSGSNMGKLSKCHPKPVLVEKTHWLLPPKSYFLFLSHFTRKCGTCSTFIQSSDKRN